ncbi:MAG: hypothetical protein ACSHX6_10965 [Akkermansiaceae bacterium]
MKLLWNIVCVVLVVAIGWLIGDLLGGVVGSNRDYRLCCMIGAIVLAILVVLPQVFMWGKWRDFGEECFGVPAMVYAVVFFVLAMVGRF